MVFFRYLLKMVCNTSRVKEGEAMKWKLSQLQTYLLVALFALIFTSIWSYVSFLNIDKQNERIVKEAIPIASAATQLYPLILDQELSVRGYLLSQDTLSLQQFERSNSRMHETLEIVREFDGQHPIMAQIINEGALPLIEELETFYMNQIQLIQEGDLAQANRQRYSELISLNAFRSVDTKIRGNVDNIIADASARSHLASQSAKWVILIVSALSFLIFFAFLHTFRVERSQQALIHKSLHDALTGIPNRRAFDEALDRFWKEARETNKPLSLLLIDIDAFKSYNDTYGHLEGDACLRKVAQVLKQTVNKPALVARYGGEEFAVLLPSDAQFVATELAEEIRQAVLKLTIAHKSYHPECIVTISIGVATVIPELYQAEDELIRRADKALYQSKEKGRNRVTVMNLA